MSSPIPRPPSRSERLLRDTLRRDDTLRTHAARSTSSNCEDDEDDDFFQSAILFRCSSRRSSAASALSYAQPPGFYVPDQNEQASYSTLLRSSSHSGSSRSGRSDRKSTAYTHEKQEESRHHDPAPHEAVLRSRLDSVIHSMQMDRDTLDSTASLPSSFGSACNSRTQSHESHHTHVTFPDPEPPRACRPEITKGHRHTQSASVVHAQQSPRRRASSPPRVLPQTPRSPRSPQALRTRPHTPSQEKDHRKRHPDSPWLYAPLPPSPPAFSTSPTKCGGPAVVAFVSSPPIIDPHVSARSHSRHSPKSSSAFDPEAASHALRQLPGYVSFSSVAGLGAPPEEEDRRSGRRPFTGFTLGGKGRLSGFGLGSGKWWVF